MRQIGFLFIGILLVAGAWQPGQAQSSVQVVKMTASHEYGRAIQFSLVAHSPVEVEQASLAAAAPGFLYTYTTDFVVRDHDIALDYTLLLDDISPAPFATVTYWWELQLVGGERLVLETQTLDYVDNRYAWEIAAADDIIVYWQGDEAIGTTALAVAQETRRRLQSMIPVQLPEPLFIYVYPSASDLRSTLRITSEDNEYWQDGHPLPSLGVLLVVAVNPRTAREDLSQSIPQEMSRFVLYQATQTQYAQLPRWLVEGMAGTVMGEQTGQTVLLRDAAAQQTIIPLSDLCTAWPTEPTQVQLAIAQSRDLIHWLVNEFGVLPLNQLIAAYRDGQGCREALSTATNLPLATLEQQWQNHWRPQPEFIRLVQENGLWFLLILAGFLLTALLLLSHWQR